MGQFSIDVKTIKMGVIPVAGTMATVITEFGEVKENTIKITEAEGTSTPIRAAGKSLPVANIVQDGDITLEFDLMSTDKDVYADLMGGTVTGTAPAKRWNKPLKKPVIEKAFEITDGDGEPIQLPRVQISATIQNVYSPTDVNVIRVKGTILQPKSATTAAIIW